MEYMEEKLENLRVRLKKTGRVAVAFSGGVDSAFLLKVAADTLGRENVLAVTASFPVVPGREQREAKEFCRENKIRQIVCQWEELPKEIFENNPTNRCYLCKRELLTRLIALAESEGFDVVAEGSNMDDMGDYRPGYVAVQELGVISPLRQAQLYKAEIRGLSRKMGLPTWDKPSFACLASRFVYGEVIDKRRLSMVEQAEQCLMDLGFRQFRVRIHGPGKDTIARIEVLPEEFERLMEPDNRKNIYETLKKLGFAYVTMDLGGYRTGSMNETMEK